MVVNSGVRSRANSCVTIWESPSKVTETSAGVVPKSYEEFKNALAESFVGPPSSGDS